MSDLLPRVLEEKIYTDQSMGFWVEGKKHMICKLMK